MAVREKEVEAIQAQAKALAQEDQSAGEVERTSRAVEEKFRALCQPMKERCRRLQASREQHQFHRDVEDEIVSHQAGHGMASYPQPRGSLVSFGHWRDAHSAPFPLLLHVENVSSKDVHGCSAGPSTLE